MLVLSESLMSGLPCTCPLLSLKYHWHAQWRHSYQRRDVGLLFCKVTDLSVPSPQVSSVSIHYSLKAFTVKNDMA